jgi:hypothetical protein
MDQTWSKQRPQAGGAPRPSPTVASRLQSTLQPFEANVSCPARTDSRRTASWACARPAASHERAARWPPWLASKVPPQLGGPTSSAHSTARLEETVKLDLRGVRVLRRHVRQQRLLGGGAGDRDLCELQAGTAVQRWMRCGCRTWYVRQPRPTVLLPNHHGPRPYRRSVSSRTCARVCSEARAPVGKLQHATGETEHAAGNLQHATING